MHFRTTVFTPIMHHYVFIIKNLYNFRIEAFKTSILV
jgi:hypothetical protein